ncbi:hypothetical protein GH733_015173, partial [Mirounga leonina]
MPGVKSSMVNLNNNGYDGIVIAINPRVQEDEKLIQNIKADVIVANPYLKYGDDPYTLQYGQCREKGQYIHFIPNFLLINNLRISWSRGTDPPPHPTFSLLKSKERVVCLVLDKSGSMSSQAAELYLLLIIEKGSLVGMVTFEHFATTQNYLTEIIGNNAYEKITANLPQEAGGGTSICSGLRAGFQAIIHTNQSTSGSEIILLTDGEDDHISSCFEEVKQSGAIIHTIALGHFAAKKLETLSNMTGKPLEYSLNRKYIFSLSYSQGSFPLNYNPAHKSKALSIIGREWINGTVPVDSTIGNDTFFFVTWTIQKPEILLQDPKGTKYEPSAFKVDKLNIRSACLRIPGIAEELLLLVVILMCSHLAKSQTLRLRLKKITFNFHGLPLAMSLIKEKLHYKNKCFLDLQEDFDNAVLVNTTSLIPKEAGSIENFEFKPEPFKTENGTKFYIAIQAIHEANLTSEVSNIAQATKLIPPQESSVSALGTNIFTTSLAILEL